MVWEVEKLEKLLVVEKTYFLVYVAFIEWDKLLDSLWPLVVNCLQKGSLYGYP